MAAPSLVGPRKKYGAACNREKSLIGDFATSDKRNPVFSPLSNRKFLNERGRVGALPVGVSER